MRNVRIAICQQKEKSFKEKHQTNNKYFLLLCKTKSYFLTQSKDSISKYKQSMVVYKFICCCDNNYVGMTSRQLGKRIKEHVPKSIEDFCKMTNKENKSVRVVNASQRSAIAEHLVNNSDCASNYNLNRFY